MSAHTHMPRSAWVYPALAVLLFVCTLIPGVGFTHSPAGFAFAAVLLVILFGTVFAAVHHAEVIAHKIGEPYGTLLLTLAVTIIEVALIATIMLGELRYREQDFQVTGVNVYLCVLIVIATITLILPNYTLSAPGPVYSASQLAFVSIVTVVLYGVFLYTQTIRHRDYFIVESEQEAADHAAASGSEKPVELVRLVPDAGEPRVVPFGP